MTTTTTTTEEIEEVFDEQPQTEGKKSTRARHLKLIFNVSDLSVEVETRYTRIKGEPFFKTVKRNKENGRKIKGGYDWHTYELDETTGHRVRICTKCNGEAIWDEEKGYLCINCKEENPVPAIVLKEVPRANVVELLVNEDGTEEDFQKFSLTKILENADIIPREQVADYIPTSVYEIFSETNVEGLYKIAEYLAKRKEAFLNQFSHGGKKVYTAIIYPVFSDGKFVFVMELSETLRKYEHEMQIPTKEGEKVEQATQPKKQPLVPLLKKQQKEQ